MTDINYEKKKKHYDHSCSVSPLFGFYVFLVLVAIIVGGLTMFF